MKSSFKAAMSLLVGGGLFLLPAVSKAEEPLTLKVEPGVAVPLTRPQTDHFNVGGAVSVRPLLGLTSFLDIGPVFSVLALPSKVSGVDIGAAWGIGAGAILRRPHNASNTGTGFSAVSPWVDADAQYVATGLLGRAALSVGAGASVPTGADRMVWVGPFVRYQDVVDSLNNRPKFDNTDAHVFVAGLSVELGPHVRPAPPVPLPYVDYYLDTDHDGTPDRLDDCPTVPGPKENFGCPYPAAKPTPVSHPPVAAQEFTFREVVYFAWDSPVLRTSENDALRSATALLLNNVKYQVNIEGHASLEGETKHNKVLSQKRAEAVLEYLVSNGVSRDRLTAVGFGSSMPAASNDNEAGRSANRRVEFDVKFVVSVKEQGK